MTTFDCLREIANTTPEKGESYPEFAERLQAIARGVVQRVLDTWHTDLGSAYPEDGDASLAISGTRFCTALGECFETEALR